MKIPRIEIGNVGQCIYCGKTDVTLQTEHIVPYGLNGPWELLNSSCQKCAAITSSFEKDVLRNSLIVPRAALSFPTRRKHKRPKLFKLCITSNGKQEIKKVPIHEHLTIMIFMITETPAYLDGRPYEKGVTVKGVSTIQVGGSPVSELAKQYKGKSISVKVSWLGNSFERLLAKIAYGFTVAQYGINRLDKTYVIPAILGKKDDIGRWVGCAPDVQLSVGKFLHEINLAVINNEVIVRVKLFALYNVPEYLVVVGRLKEV